MPLVMPADRVERHTAAPCLASAFRRSPSIESPSAFASKAQMPTPRQSRNLIVPKFMKGRDDIVRINLLLPEMTRYFVYRYAVLLRD